MDRIELSRSPLEATALASLVREWRLVVAIWLAVWLATYVGLRQFWPLATQWLALSGVTLAVALWILRRHLPENRAADGTPLLPHLGPGNHLTLFRGLCVGLIAGFVFGPWPLGMLGWAIALAYTAADIADYFDGLVARRSHQVTRLGGVLDIEFDALGVLVVTLLAASFGQLPWWYVSLGLARYLFVFGIWWRQRRGLPVYDLTPSIHRRLVAGLQMGFMSVVLWPVVPAAMTQLAGSIFFAASAASFGRDWLVVSGAIDPQSPIYRQVQQAAVRWLTRWLPLVWRPMVVIGLSSILLAAQPTFQPATWRGLLASWPIPAPDLWATLLVLILIAGLVCVGLGVVGRTASILLYLPIGFDIATRNLLLDNGAALVGVTFIILFGTGPLSLWRLEDHIINRPLGVNA